MDEGDEQLDIACAPGKKGPSSDPPLKSSSLLFAWKRNNKISSWCLLLEACSRCAKGRKEIKRRDLAPHRKTS